LQLVPDYDPDHDEELDAELAGLRTGFPQFRIWREISGNRTRYIARSLQPGARPHTLVTADPRELRAALNIDESQARPDHPDHADHADHPDHPDRSRVFESRMPNIARVGWLVGLDTLGSDSHGADGPGATHEGTRPGQRDLRRADSGTARPLRRTATGRRAPNRPNPPVAGARHWKESPEDVRCWQEAARLRREHPGWIVLWLARIRQFRAYRLQARRDTVLTAATPADLTAQIARSDREVPGRAPRPRGPAD
jgi:hypothetical protein